MPIYKRGSVQIHYEERCITMDLRSAKGGGSSGPVEVDRPWDAYADDQLGLMDYLGKLAEPLVNTICRQRRDPSLGLLLRAPAYLLRLLNELRQELRNRAFFRRPRDRLPPSTELGNATTTKSLPWIDVNVRPIVERRP